MVARFVAIAAVLVLLMGPCGDVVVGAMETGYEARESNTRLAVATAQASGAERGRLEELEREYGPEIAGEVEREARRLMEEDPSYRGMADERGPENTP